MIYKQMTREQMISELICDNTRLYDILDVPFFVDIIIDQTQGEYMIWDAESVWNMYCELRKEVAEEKKESEVH